MPAIADSADDVLDELEVDDDDSVKVTGGCSSATLSIPFIVFIALLIDAPAAAAAAPAAGVVVLVVVRKASVNGTSTNSETCTTATTALVQANNERAFILLLPLLQHWLQNVT